MSSKKIGGAKEKRKLFQNRMHKVSICNWLYGLRRNGYTVKIKHTNFESFATKVMEKKAKNKN